MLPLAPTLAWGFMLLLMAAGGPLARLLATCQNGQRETALALALTPVLSVGALSLSMLWLGWIGVAFEPMLPALCAFSLLLVPPMIARWRGERGLFAFPRLTVPQGRLPRLTLLVCLGVSAAVLVNALFWPFHREDTLGIYHVQALEIARARALLSLTGADSLYLTYPMLAQLHYAYVYLLSGWPNEYLAKLGVTLMALACLPAAYMLGKMLGGVRVGWLAALLLTLMPTFGRWASSGYVDLPMACAYALAGVFALRCWQPGSGRRDAIAAGLLLGGAAFTKNAALLGVPLLAVWLAVGALQERTRWRHVALALGACALVGAPWYVRNLLGAGFIMPATAWVEQAQPTLANLFAFVLELDNFGLSGLFLLGGVAWGVAQVWRSRRTHPYRDTRVQASAPAFLLWWALPFFAAWWRFVSYDPRFLLLIVPPLCALGSGATLWAWERIAVPRARMFITGAILALGLYVVWVSVEYKGQLLRDPLMSHEAKLAVVGRDGVP